MCPTLFGVFVKLGKETFYGSERVVRSMQHCRLAVHLFFYTQAEGSYPLVSDSLIHIFRLYQRTMRVSCENSRKTGIYSGTWTTPSVSPNRCRLRMVPQCSCSLIRVTIQNWVGSTSNKMNFWDSCFCSAVPSRVNYSCCALCREPEFQSGTDSVPDWKSPTTLSSSYHHIGPPKLICVRPTLIITSH